MPGKHLTSSWSTIAISIRLGPKPAGAPRLHLLVRVQSSFLGHEVNRDALQPSATRPDPMNGDRTSELHYDSHCGLHTVRRSSRNDALGEGRKNISEKLSSLAMRSGTDEARPMISPSSRSVPSSDNGSHFEDDGADLATSLAPEKGWAGWIMISIRFKGSSIPRLPAGISAGCREACSCSCLQ